MPRRSESSSAIVENLVRAALDAPAALAKWEDLHDLPAPVARYLRRTVPDGQPLIRLAHFRQAGVLRTDVQSRRWLSFKAQQIVAPPAPGFLWNARVEIAPLLHVRVRDSLVAGQGSGQVSLLSLFRLAAEGGTREMNSGALHRYLAEAVWYPTALLPSSKLKWSAIDSDKALATLTANGVAVSLEFSFNGHGEITGIYAPDRWGRFGGAYRQAPWQGYFARYEERAGMLIPMEGEVGWHSAGEWQSVWKGAITHVSYRTSFHEL